jgi:hypothetical protein
MPRAALLAREPTTGGFAGVRSILGMRITALDTKESCLIYK